MPVSKFRGRTPGRFNVGLYLYTMKIILSEIQVRNLMGLIESDNYIRLSDEVIQDRLMKAKELAKDFKNPRQFALVHKQLFSFLKQQKLIDDVFPNRLKQLGDLSPESALKIANKYGTIADLKSERASVYQYLLRNNLLDTAYPNSEENFNLSTKYQMHLGGDENPNLNPEIGKYLDYLMDRASRYEDMKDLEKRNPPLYRHLVALGHDMRYDNEEYEEED